MFIILRHNNKKNRHKSKRAKIIFFFFLRSSGKHARLCAMMLLMSNVRAVLRVVWVSLDYRGHLAKSFLAGPTEPSYSWAFFAIRYVLLSPMGSSKVVRQMMPTPRDWLSGFWGIVGFQHLKRASSYDRGMIPPDFSVYLLLIWLQVQELCAWNTRVPNTRFWCIAESASRWALL